MSVEPGWSTAVGSVGTETVGRVEQQGPLGRPRPAVGPPHEALEQQQAFVDACARLLPRARANGQRLVTALYLVLAAHPAHPVVTAEGTVHLTCAECRPGDREPAAQYPCPSAQQAFWALQATLGGR